ncbi:prepilin peptidase [Halovivax gelatinilyticus]|uniref:prepilin peptidase n=1 Tax=Halovivax gelatinilyticus TaxID=2961597 RepID=UPI0020CA995F|nr:A24 family peptidase C-terminal domain-containing protein [Halovivax gelatinilyticus]
MTLSGVSASGPDLLRLLTIPVFAWVAILDIRTRRVPSAAWIPLGALGAGLLVWDGWIAYQADVVAWQEFLIPAALSLGFVVPLAYLFWWFGGFGGADAKALLVLALLFPVVPSYAIGGLSFPLAGGDELLPFSLSILANGVLVGLAIPVALAIRNALAGRVTGVMALGWPVSTDRIPETHGRLLQTTEGVSLGGLDLDALRMYLRWRGLTLDDVREDPDRYRDPSSLPDVPNPPTDGAVTVANPVADGGKHEEATAGDETAANDSASESDDESTASEAAGESDGEFDDPWGADAFLESIEGTAYGTSAADLRDGLDVLTQEETVWISPGTPFLVPLFAGLVLALGYGDLLVTLVM